MKKAWQTYYRAYVVAFFMLLPRTIARRYAPQVDRLNLWLEKRDTVILEGLLACSAFVNGLQVLMVDKHGDSLAPFLNSAIGFLVFDRLVWITLLLLLGMLKMLALIHGQINNNGYVWRARLASIASFVWSAIWLAVFFSPEPKIVAARYVLAWVGSVSVYLVLHTKQRLVVKKKREVVEREAAEVQELFGSDVAVINKEPRRVTY